MKISQIVPMFPPSLGGVETYVCNLVKRLRKLGHDVSVITSDIPPVGSYIMDGIRIHRLPVLFKFHDAPFCPSLFPKLLKIKADIVHTHMPPRFFTDCVSILHKMPFFSVTPLILSFHLYLEKAPPFIRALSNLHYQTATHLIFDSSSKIIVPTETYKNLLTERFNIRAEKVNVIPYAVDSDVFNPRKFQKEEIKKKYGVFSEKVILFIGRLDVQGAEQKGIKYLLEAIPLIVKEVNDVKFIIVGGGERLSYFRDFCKNLGIVPYVKFIGNFPHDQIPSLFSMADVFVLPSLYESFGIVLCEAMSMEKPVVATRVGGIPDVVIDGKTGILVEKKNIHELASAIVTVLSDKKLATDMGRLGRKLVQEKYMWSVVTKKILDVYKNAT